MRTAAAHWLLVWTMCVGCGGPAPSRATADSASGGADGSGGASDNEGSERIPIAGSPGAGGSGGRPSCAVGTGGTVDDGSGASGNELESACSVSSECIVVPASCCGECDLASRGDAVAINKRFSASHRAEACVGVEGTCPSPGWEGCYADPVHELLATCEAGRCKLVDLRTNAASECMSDDDCVLRSNKCCPCEGSGWDWVAVNRCSHIEPIVCDPGSGCTGCAPVAPSGVYALCSSGRCYVQGISE